MHIYNFIFITHSYIYHILYIYYSTIYTKLIYIFIFITIFLIKNLNIKMIQKKRKKI